MWGAILERVDRPKRSLAERALSTLGIREDVAKLLATTPALRAAWFAGYELSETYALALVMSIAGIGFSIDDPAAETVGASPTTLARRRLGSAAIVCAVVLAAWATIAVAVAMSASQHFPTYDIAIELTALASIGLATSAFVQRRTTAPGGPTSALVVLVGPVFMAGAVFRDIKVFPSLVPGQDLRDRWVWLAVIAGASLAHLSSDPGRN